MCALTTLGCFTQVTETRAALKAAEAALTAAKTELEAAGEQRNQLATDITLAEQALTGERDLTVGTFTSFRAAIGSDLTHELDAGPLRFQPASAALLPTPKTSRDSGTTLPCLHSLGNPAGCLCGTATEDKVLKRQTESEAALAEAEAAQNDFDGLKAAEAETDEEERQLRAAQKRAEQRASDAARTKSRLEAE